MKFKDFFKGKIPIISYCPPTPQYYSGGRLYESKINELQYKRMKEVGVTVVAGHNYYESGTKEEHDYAVELCGKFGISYLLRLQIFQEYLALEGNRYGYKAFAKLDEEEREALKNRFLAELSFYEQYPAFAGVIFVDEPCALQYTGIREAKTIFEKKYPDKLFFVNMFGYFILPNTMQNGEYGKEPIPESYLMVDHKDSYRNFAKDYLNIVEPDVFCYDLYPIISLNGERWVVHKALYELGALVKDLCLAHSKDMLSYACLQAGGKWEGSLLTRVPSYSETAIQVNVLLALGFSGFMIFPYCFPDCWTEDTDVEAGLIDKFGDTTERYWFFKKIFGHLKSCEKIFAEDRYAGFFTSGKFFGLCHTEEELKTVKDGDCYFTGKVDGGCKIDIPTEISKVEVSSQILCGVFDGKDRKSFLVVNNSVTTMLKGYLQFDKEYEITSFYNGEISSFVGDRYELNVLPGGESVLISLKV